MLTSVVKLSVLAKTYTQAQSIYHLLSTTLECNRKDCRAPWGILWFVILDNLIPLSGQEPALRFTMWLCFAISHMEKAMWLSPSGSPQSLKSDCYEINIFKVQVAEDVDVINVVFSI